ncbi:MAG: lysophospholipid acyltransferase family protein [Hyphomicrobiaceae bacterium]
MATHNSGGNRWRAGAVLASFFAFTIPLMPLQALFVRVHKPTARWFPNWYHRNVCRILGVRLNIDGAVVGDRPVLLVSNHTSWLDIPILSAVAPISFVAKKEVGTWPFVASLARLQRTVFVDRRRRMEVNDTTTEITRRLDEGDTVVLFAEGTSSDGNRVLPFKTSLFAAAKPPIRRRPDEKQSTDEKPIKDDKPFAQDANQTTRTTAVVQTISLVYTKLHGIPISRGERSLVGWYGDMEMQSHAWRLLKAGPLDVDIRISPPVPLADYEDRKDLARASEELVRKNVVAALRGLPVGHQVAVTRPDPSLVHKVTGTSESSRKERKWR